jgi:hypothetical protein
MSRGSHTQQDSRIEYVRRIGRVIPSQKLAFLLNWLQRAAGIKDNWIWLEVPELANGIEIAAIICPLRYDVLLRRDFFTFYAAHCDLYDSDRRVFVALVKQTSYYTWYLESEAVRLNGKVRDNARELEWRFLERLDRATSLYKSVQMNGFLTRFPIVLKTAKHLLPPTTERGGPPTGKQVGARYFLADGCHRLALLMALGYKVLPAGYFWVKYYQEFSPFDSTSLLARRLLREPAAYFRFLSTYYTAPVVMTNRNDFLSYVTNHNPVLLDEVRSVIRTDGFDNDRD